MTRLAIIIVSYNSRKDLENALRLEWERAEGRSRQPWEDVREEVRRGYER